MLKWKRDIFVQAVNLRIGKGEGTEEEIIDTYTKLTKTEKAEILAAL